MVSHPVLSLPCSFDRVCFSPVTLACTKGFASRLSIYAVSDCLDSIASIPKAIGQFLVHTYADMHMYGRAWSSMGGATDDQEIERRMNEVGAFRMLLQNPHSSSIQLARRFNGGLPVACRDLFYYTGDYLDQLRSAPPASHAQLRSEILRECEQVASYQRTMTLVNTLYRIFTGRMNVPSPISLLRNHWDAGSSIAWADRWDAGSSIDRDPSSEVGRTTPVITINIPGTVPYVLGAIPADVLEKANEITILSAAFAAPGIRPAIPGHFKDAVSLNDFMEIPVFDASHPQIRNTLPALQIALAGGARMTPEQITSRHSLDSASMEQVMGYANPGNRRCVTCRHPDNYAGINRANLKIDTALQDDILTFLRRAMTAGSSASSV